MTDDRTRSATPTDGWTVDDRCINCNLARQYAPGIIGFERTGGDYGGRSVMLRQPETDDEVGRLYKAAYACPTRSVHPPAGEWDESDDPYPMPLDEDGVVLLCGHTSLRTFGATSYLCRRPGGTAMMIDTPRFQPALARRYVEAVGPVTDVLLTHVDHVAHGRKWADALDARLWIHEGDLDSRPDADRVIRGHDPVEIGPGMVAHPFPGHSPGTTLFIADETFCFAGDALFWSETYDRLDLADSVVYDSVARWARSVEKGADELTFEWVLPGHGPYQHRSAAEMRQRMRALAQRALHFEEPEFEDYGAVRY
jgi:glyoxylase-like metal-dependent hydrolase (beta-lactamase superfamily II)